MVGREGETMSVQTGDREVLDWPAGALQDKSIGDLGRCEALGAPDELKRGPGHRVSPHPRSGDRVR
jgi:hypothetical protein